MLCVRGRDFRAVLAGAIICMAVADGVAAAPDGAEIKEDLGGSYALARRTTGQGSIIETLLYDGRAIVTDIVIPGQGGSVAADVTGVTPAAAAPTGRAGATAVTTGTGAPAGVAPSFGGTLLSAEVNDGYLVLHRTRAGDPVMHDIFRDGEKVGSVSEVVSAGSKPGRNSFVFESTADRFIVHLTQPDGTKIRATSEHGRFSGQVVERVAVAPTEGVAKKELAPATAPPAQISNIPSKAASERRPIAGPQPRQPAPRAAAVQPGIVSRGFYGNAPEPAAVAPVARSKPLATVNAQSQGVAAARPVARAARPSRPPASGASSLQGPR
jgi:hypothetical protein